MEKKGNGIKIAIIVDIALLLFGLVITFCQLFNSANKYGSIITLVVYAATIFYAFYAYKKPHGDLLRIAFIAFATALALLICRPDEFQPFIKYIFCAPIVLTAFTAGRLNRLEENKTYIIVIEAVLVAAAVLSLFTVAPDAVAGAEGMSTIEPAQMAAGWYTKFLAFNPAIQFGTLALSYTVRFNEHKKAGEEAK